MEDNKLTNKSKYVTIGEFVISFSRYCRDIIMEMPFSGMAFYQSQMSLPDFNFTVNNVEQYNSEILLFGSDDFFSPTFLYKRENGHFDWITKNKNGEPIYKIAAVIYCLRESHKGIIIGKNGAMLKRIGTLARKDMEHNFETKVNLQTWVKVKKDWQNDEKFFA